MKQHIFLCKHCQNELTPTTSRDALARGQVLVPVRTMPGV